MTKYTMAGGYKSKYKRKYARKGRVAQLAKGKTTSVQALAKAVKSIQRSMRTKCEYLNYGYQGTISITASPAEYLNMSNFAGFADIFGSSSNDDDANRIVHKSFGIDMYLTLENTVNEPDTTQFTVMMVSLKDNIGQYFSPATGALSLTSGITHVQQGGMVLLNKKMFKIHKTKRVVFSNHGASLATSTAQTQSGTDWRGYWKFRPNALITNPAGDWKSSSTAIDPSKQYYLLIFHDNSSVDLQNPRFSFNSVHTMQTVA